MLQKIISGGQTGVDRAGLDAALAAAIPVGGWCPKGRLAEDGVVPAKYPLVEMKSSSYTSRTEQNVIDSDGTLVLNQGKLSGGTRRTVEFAHKHGKPFHVVQLDEACTIVAVIEWINVHTICTLNIAGPRESKYPGINSKAYAFLLKMFEAAGA